VEVFVSVSSSGDDTRGRILEAAGPVFAEKGYRKATVREICRAADVNLAAVNYYFGDKERLYIETVKCAHQMRVQQVPLREWSAETLPVIKLRGFIETLVTRMVGLEEAPWQARLMLREILEPTAACKELVDAFFRPYFDRLLAILDEMLPKDTPPYQRRQIGFSIVGQCLYYRVAGEVVSMLVSDQERARHYSIPQLVDHITEFTLAALGLGRPLGNRFASGGRSVASLTDRDR
jgi:AcrR family transcriptional regulator